MQHRQQVMTQEIALVTYAISPTLPMCIEKSDTITRAIKRITTSMLNFKAYHSAASVHTPVCGGNSHSPQKTDDFSCSTSIVAFRPVLCFRRKSLQVEICQLAGTGQMHHQEIKATEHIFFMQRSFKWKE